MLKEIYLCSREMRWQLFCCSEAKPMVFLNSWRQLRYEYSPYAKSNSTGMFSQCSRYGHIYKIRLSLESASEPCDDLLLTLLAELSPKINHSNTKYKFLIGNIITGVLTNRPIPLQIALGPVIREKSLKELCTEFGITCTYHEALHFKKSVAHIASRDHSLQDIMSSDVGLVPTVADYFGDNIASLKATNSLNGLWLNFKTMT